MFLVPDDIHGCILYNVTVTSKVGTKDPHLRSCVCCYQFLLCMINDLFSVIIFASLVMNDTVLLYSHGCIFISKSAYDSNQRTQTGVARCESFHYNKEDMMEVMICRKLHAAIRSK